MKYFLYSLLLLPLNCNSPIVISSNLKSSKATINKINSNELIIDKLNVQLETNYSVQLRSYIYYDTLFNQFKHINKLVLSQELFFMKDDSIINVISSPCKLYTNNSNYGHLLKYRIVNVMTQKFRNDYVYILHLYSSNGSSEYDYVYSRLGVLLFYQNCNISNCTITSNKISKNEVITFFNNSSITNTETNLY